MPPPERGARGRGMIGGAFGFGFIRGRALGGGVAGHDLATADLRTPGLIAAGLSLLAVLGVVFLLKESLTAAAKPDRPARSRATLIMDALGRPVLSRLLLIFFLVTFAFRGMEATFAMGAVRP